MSGKMRKPSTDEPRKPPEDIREKQDPEHSEGDFFRDLAKASTDQARKKLGLPSGRGRE